jgi:hypothetical protein
MEVPTVVPKEQKVRQRFVNAAGKIVQNQTCGWLGRNPAKLKTLRSEFRSEFGAGAELCSSLPGDGRAK